jgi:hypothetical protein
MEKMKLFIIAIILFILSYILSLFNMGSASKFCLNAGIAAIGL